MFDHDAAQFTAPIPGQSLTTEPQGRPWETPAKYSDPEDALTYYVSKIGTADRTAHMLEVLESGLPAAKLVDSITLAGVMEGLHSIDTAIIISPSLPTEDIGNVFNTLVLEPFICKVFGIILHV